MGAVVRGDDGVGPVRVDLVVHQVADAVECAQLRPPGALGGEPRPMRLDLGPVRGDGLAPYARLAGDEVGIRVLEAGRLEVPPERVLLPIRHQHVVAGLGPWEHRRDFLHRERVADGRLVVRQIRDHQSHCYVAEGNIPP